MKHIARGAAQTRTWKTVTYYWDYDAVRATEVHIITLSRTENNKLAPIAEVNGQQVKSSEALSLLRNADYGEVISEVVLGVVA